MNRPFFWGSVSFLAAWAALTSTYELIFRIESPEASRATEPWLICLTVSVYSIHRLVRTFLQADLF
jgi:hypothetical protein